MTKEYLFSHSDVQTVAPGSEPLFTVIAARSIELDRMMGKIQFFDMAGIGIHSRPANHDVNWTFERVGFSSLNRFEQWLKAQDGRHIITAGDLVTEKHTHHGKRRMSEEKYEDDSPKKRRKEQPSETIVNFEDTPSNLLVIDVDRGPNDVDMFNPASWSNAARMLLEEIVPFGGDAQFVIAPSASCYPGHIRFRMFIVLTTPLTLAEKRLLVGPLLETTTTPSEKTYGCDPSIYASPNNAIYLKGHYIVVRGTKNDLDPWLASLNEKYIDAKRQTWPSYMATLRGENAPAGLLEFRDPYQAVRVMRFRSASENSTLNVHKDMLTYDRIEHLKRRAKKIQSIPTTQPLSKAQRRAQPYLELAQIPWKSGTHDYIKEWIAVQGHRSAMQGDPVDGQALHSMLDTRLQELIVEATQALDKDRVATLKGYRSREIPRLIAWATASFKDSDFYLDHIVVDEDDDEPTPAWELAVSREEPTNAIPTVVYSLRDAEEILDRKLKGFAENVRMSISNRPLLIRGTVGLGKSRAVREIVMRLIGEPGLSIAIVVPTHKLAGEYLGEFEAISPGLATVYRGKDHVPDPTTQKQICQIAAEDRKIWQGARGSGLTACEVCAFKRRHELANGGPCPYYMQDVAFDRARVHIYAGPQVIHSPIPEIVRQKTEWVARPGETDDDLSERAAASHLARPPQYCLVIVDETQATEWFTRDAIVVDTLVRRLRDSKHFSEDTDSSLPKADAIDTFNELVPRLVGALREESVESALFRGMQSIESKLGKADIFRLRDAANRLRIHGTRAEAQEVFGRTGLREHMLRSLEQKVDLATQIYAVIEIIDTLRAGGSVRFRRLGAREPRVEMLDWSRVAPLHDHWAGADFMVLDATGDTTLLAHWWPDLEPETIMVEEPKTARRLFVEGSVNYSDFKKEKDKRALVAKCNAIITTIKAHEPTEFEPVVGVIGPKAIVGVARDQAGDYIWASEQDGVLLSATFGSTRGLNHMRHVDELVIFSRPLPGRAEIERAAGDIKGGTVDGANPNAPLQSGMREVWVRTGEGIELGEVECWTHADPIARAVLDAGVHAELVQADGRARAIRRGHNRGIMEQSDSVTIWHITGKSVPGLIYDTPALPGMGSDQVLSLSMADLDASTPRGSVMRLWRQGLGGWDGPTWALWTDAEDHLAFRKMLSEQLTPRLIRDAADIRAKERVDKITLLQGELSNDNNFKVVQDVVASLVARGSDLSTAAGRREAKAEAQSICRVNGIEWKEHAWKNVIYR